MVEKIRLIRTMVVEYEPIADFYPEGATIEEMAQIDADSDDRELLFDGNDLVKDEIEWQIFEED